MKLLRYVLIGLLCASGAFAQVPSGLSNPPTAADVIAAQGYTSANKAGETFTGPVAFSGTTNNGIRVNNLTTTQKNALTALAGNIVYDSTLGRLQGYDGAAWHSYVRLDGDTVLGDLLFTDGLYDIGKTGATRPRDGFFSRNLTVGGTVGISGTLTYGVATGTSLALANATLGSNGFAATGASFEKNINGSSTGFGTLRFLGNPESTSAANVLMGDSVGVRMRSGNGFCWSSSSSDANTAADTCVTRIGSTGIVGAGTTLGGIDGTFKAATFTASANFATTAGTVQYMGTGGGSADVITVTPSPALTAYTIGAIYFYKSAAANATTTPNWNASGLGAKTIVKRAATALAVGDIPNAAMIILMYDGTNMQLLNPIVN